MIGSGTYHKYSNEQIPTFEIANCKVGLGVGERFSQSLSSSLDVDGFGRWRRHGRASAFSFIRHESKKKNQERREYQVGEQVGLVGRWCLGGRR